MTPSDTDELHRAFVDGGIVLDEPAAHDPYLAGPHITITGGHWFNNDLSSLFEVGPIHKPAEIEALVAVLKSRGRHNSLHDINRAADTLTALQAENEDAFMRGVAHGQNIVRGKTFHVIDSPELVTLRAQLAAAEKEREAHKSRGDNHWETMRCIYRIATEEGDMQAVIQHIKDAGHGYTERPEETLRRYQTDLAAAVARAEKAEGEQDAAWISGRDAAQEVAVHRAQDWGQDDDLSDWEQPARIIAKDIAALPDAKGGK